VSVFVLWLIVLFAAEVIAFIVVGDAIGFLWAVLALLGTSLIGWEVLRTQGRAALGHVSAAVSERRPPGPGAFDRVLGFLGGGLLFLPGFATDAAGVLLLLPPTRALVRRLISRHYVARIVSFAASTGRFAPGGGGFRPGDIDGTAVEDDLGELPR